jgi:hypothetical protein
MKSLFIFILAGIALTTISGCVVLPAPSTEHLDDQAKMFRTLEPGEKILIYGFNGILPTYWGEPYFSMGCMNYYTNRTDKVFTRLILKLNPVPGQFALIEATELGGDGAMVAFSGPSPPVFDISVKTAEKERLRYVILLRETLDTSLHIPLYVIPFGISMCGNKSVLEASIWEVPSGESLGSVSVTSTGEFTGLAWIFHVLFDPETQRKATAMLATDLLKRLTGKPVEGHDAPEY